MKKLAHATPLAIAAVAAFAAGGIAAGTPAAAEAATCPPPPALSQPFLAWGDSQKYALVPGASFESTLGGWSFAAGSVVAGNEPWFLHSYSDTRSFALAAGVPVTTAAICEPLLQPVARLFVRNAGSMNALLHVEFVMTRNGAPYVVDGGYVSAKSSWSLTPVLGGFQPFPVTGALQLRLTAVGSNAAFQIDDVYVDPYLSR